MEREDLVRRKFGLVVCSFWVFLLFGAVYSVMLNIPLAHGWTSVEGHIVEDTTWTLANSPYRLVGDVIVDSGVKLTIEPGVRVEFEDGLSLFVNGSLYAVGTAERQINFTSSRPDPSPGVWNTIKFVGGENEFFRIGFSVITYAINGITIATRDGYTLIEKCEISLNLESGIVVMGSSNAVIKENVIKKNKSGIATDSSDIHSGLVIADNSILLNEEDGIFLNSQGSSSFIFNVTFSSNAISFNGGSGIHLYSISYGYGSPPSFGYSCIFDVTVSSNIVLSNSKAGISLYSKSYGNKSYSYIHDVTVSSNIVSGNGGSGVQLYSSDYGYPYFSNFGYGYIYNIAFSSNIVSSNQENGIFLYSSGFYEGSIYKVTVSSNTLSANNEVAIGFDANFSVYSVKVYHNNFINNTSEAYISYPISWDDGYPSGGNHWSDYYGTDLFKGPYQNEVGSDGIGDTPYVIDANNEDRYPLMNPWIPPPLPAEAYISVPYHHQITSYYCGPAALEMLFDFYGPDISQLEIADVARTSLSGTFTFDMIRAAHFSNLSTSVGKEMDGNITGYTARKLGYAAFEYGGMSIDTLKSLIAADYPVIVLTTWHYRVAVGYSQTHITFQDSYYGKMYNMTYQAFDDDWDYSNHWALFVSPWKIEISVPHNIWLGSVFNVTASISYPSPPPFPTDQYAASLAKATISLPAGLSLVSGETAKKTLGTGDLAAGTSANVTWTVHANSPGNYTISVDAEGKVAGFVPPLPPSYPEPYSYEDRIGGAAQVDVSVFQDEIPPTTLDDYDDSWHTADFTVNLSATDDQIGVAETYYKINNGATRKVSLYGQPLITTEGANNTLEYWSIDNAGNEELPHKILTEIKLDKTYPTIETPSRTPDGDVMPDQPVKVSVNVTDATSGVKNVTFSYTTNDGATWTNLPMSYNLSTNLYEVIVPSQPVGTWVQYKITVYDNAQNQAANDNTGEYYTYLVVPEFASVLILPLFIALTTLSVALAKRVINRQRRSRQQ